MLGRRSRMQQELLEANGLPSHLAKEEVAQLQSKALQSYLKSKRIQTIAVVLWCLHCLLFALTFSRYTSLVSAYYGNPFGLGGGDYWRNGLRSVGDNLLPPNGVWLPLAQSDIALILHWLHAVVFLLAVVSTIRWFLHDRSAATNEYVYRLASLEREPESTD